MARFQQSVKQAWSNLSSLFPKRKQPLQPFRPPTKLVPVRLPPGNARRLRNVELEKYGGGLASPGWQVGTAFAENGAREQEKILFEDSGQTTASTWGVNEVEAKNVAEADREDGAFGIKEGDKDVDKDSGYLTSSLSGSPEQQAIASAATVERQPVENADSAEGIDPLDTIQTTPNAYHLSPATTHTEPDALATPRAFEEIYTSFPSFQYNTPRNSTPPEITLREASDANDSPTFNTNVFDPPTQDPRDRSGSVMESTGLLDRRFPDGLQIHGRQASYPGKRWVGGCEPASQ